MHRRQYLRVAVVSCMGLLAGGSNRKYLRDGIRASNSPSESDTTNGDSDPEKTDPMRDEAPKNHGIEFDRVMNAVEDLGMDPTGDDPIDDAIARAYRQGTLIQFPPGEYTLSDSYAIDGDVSQFGIQGTGDDHGDVTFCFPNADNSYWFVHQNGGEDVLLDNFTIDTEEKYVGVRCRTHGGSVIRDVEWRGFLPEKNSSLGQLLDPGCLSVDGVNTVRRVIIGRDGAHVSGHYTRTGIHSMTGIRFYGTDTRSGRMGHVGETILEDVEIHQIGSNGVRHTHGDGVVTVRGGLYKNCHLSSLRIHNGNHPSKDSSVTGATILIDHEDAGPIGTGEWSKHGSNGIMFDSTGHGYSQPTYEDCDIICRSILSDGGWGLIRVTNTGRSNPGGGVFKNCRVINETNLQTVQIDPRKPNADPPQAITFDGVDIYLSGDSQPQGAVVTLNDGWDGSTISGSTIYASEGDVNGIHVRNCSDVTIENTTISVPGYLFTATDSNIITRELSSNKPDDIPN